MFKRQYFFILFVLKICTGGIANYIYLSLPFVKIIPF